MSFFYKEKPKNTGEYVVLPQSKERALAEAIKIKSRRISKLNLKKDLARYMEKHHFDKIDTRRLGREIKFRAIEE